MSDNDQQDDPTVFLSYSWDDDKSFVKQLYIDLTAAGLTVWWDEENMPSRGNTLRQELRDTIDKAGRFVPVIGSAALAKASTPGSNLALEWEYARLSCKAITPVIRHGNPQDIPDDFRAVLYFDFRDDAQYREKLDALVKRLMEPPAHLGTLQGVPSLPDHHLPRSTDLETLSRMVRGELHLTAITTEKQTAALQGMGGVGKSVLAMALARECETRRAFPDGIFWLIVGQNPTEAALLSHMRAIGTTFGDNPAHYVELNDAKLHLGEILSARACLLILDDVWNVHHAEDFRNALGTRCRMLVTTRDGAVAEHIGEPYQLDVLDNKAALNLLAAWAGVAIEKLPAQAADVTGECGNLPFALALCGAMVRDGTLWRDLLDALREADLSFIEAQFPNYPYPDILRALKVSIDALSKEARKHYHELALFPEDTAIPEETIVMLWLHTNGLNERSARKLITDLHNKSLLIVQGPSPNRHIRLHDLNHDYLRAVLNNSNALHLELIAAYREKCREGWHTGPNDGYFFQYLPRHLKNGGCQNELDNLLVSFPWLQAKLNATDTNNMLTDYDLTEDIELKQVKEAIRLSVHALNQNRAQLWPQIYGRLLGISSSKIGQLLGYRPEAIWLRALVPSLVLPGGPLEKTLWLSGEDENRFFTTVTVTADGINVIAGVSDCSIRIWDIGTGQQLKRLVGHTMLVDALAATPDSKRVVSASRDGTVRVWDLDSGQELFVLKGHDGQVSGLAISLDGKKVISASHDTTLKIWDILEGKEDKTLTGHKDIVLCVAVLSDNNHAISGSGDQTLRIWDLRTGQEEARLTTGHLDWINAVAVIPDTNRVLSAADDGSLELWDLDKRVRLSRFEHRILISDYTPTEATLALTQHGHRAVFAVGDNTLRVWDLEQGIETAKLRGHSGSIHAVSSLPDNRRVVSASGDGTLKIWDIGAISGPISSIGHSARINSLAASSDGNYVVSASDDQTVRIWKINPISEFRSFAGNGDSVRAVAVVTSSQLLISGSRDGVIKAWNTDSGVTALTFRYNAGFYIVGVSSIIPLADSRVIIGVGQIIEVWNPLSQQEPTTLVTGTANIDHLVVTSNERQLVFVSSFIDSDGYFSSQLHVHDLASGEEEAILGTFPLIRAICSIPNTSQVIVGTSERIRIVDLAASEIRSAIDIRGSSVNSVAVSPNGQFLVGAFEDGGLRIWSLSSAEQITEFIGDSAMTACVVLPDNHTIVAGEESGRVHFLHFEDVQGAISSN